MSSKTTRKKTTDGGRPEPSGSRFSWGNAVGLVIVLGICAFALWGFFGPAPAGQGAARPVTPQELARRNAADAPRAVPAAPVPSQPPSRQGRPWEYDPATNHHWDPRAGHQHWHQGPPPPEDQRAEVAQPTLTPVTLGEDGQPIPMGDGMPIPMGDAMPIQTPNGPDRTGTPWEYDAGTDTHWDPRPGHEHWHRGQPPPEDQRQ